MNAGPAGKGPRLRRLGVLQGRRRQREASRFWMAFYLNSEKLLSWEHLEWAEAELLGYPETDLP